MNQSEYNSFLGQGVLILDSLEIIVGTIGILANSLTIYILVVKMNLRGSDTIQSFVLAVLDILFSIFTVVNCICVWSSKHTLMLNNNTYIQTAGYLFYSMGPSVIDSVMILALIRYFGICRQIQFKNSVWIIITLTLISFNFLIGLNCLSESNYIVQPSLKYSAVEFNSILGWKNNTYYCILWTKLTINVIIILLSYFFISLYYRNYLKKHEDTILNFNTSASFKSSEEIEKIDCYSPKITDNQIIQNESNFSTDSEFEIYDNTRQRSTLSADHKESTVSQSSRMVRLVKSTQIKLYTILIVYLVEIVPFFLFQTIFKFLKVPNSTFSDSLVSFLTHLVPVTNPCFVLFCNFETYQELLNTLSSLYCKLFS